MNEGKLMSLLEKIRSICKECQLNSIPQRTTQNSHIVFDPYLTALQHIKTEFLQLKLLQEEYFKLEEFLQKQQTEIRKRIGVEQQFKLYTQTLKSQVQQLQNEKAELLQNTKSYIKQLKKTNQTLFEQLHSKAFQKVKFKQKSHQSSPEKSKHNRSVSHQKPKHDKSIKEIVKTQYIDRQRSSSAKPHPSKKKNRFGAYSTISAHQTDYKRNSKTFQVIHSNQKQKQKATRSKKKNQYGFSNFTLLNILDNSQTRLKSKHKSRSPLKGGKKEVKGQGKNRNCKQKKANKSIFSLVSMQPNLSSKKQTI